LCNECFKPIYIKWFNEESVIVDDFCESYKLEENILNLIKSFPIETQKYVWDQIT